MTEVELLQVAGEQGPIAALVMILLAREWKAHLRERRAQTAATLDDLVQAVTSLQASIESMQTEIRSWFEERIL